LLRSASYWSIRVLRNDASAIVQQQLHESDCNAIVHMFKNGMHNSFYSCNSIASRMQSNSAAIAQQIRGDCVSITKRLRSDLGTIVERLKSDFAVNANPIQSDTA
jgi:hypothetical protein